MWAYSLILRSGIACRIPSDKAERCLAYTTAYTALSVSRETHNAEQAARLRVYETFLAAWCGGVPVAADTGASLDQLPDGITLNDG